MTDDRYDERNGDGDDATRPLRPLDPQTRPQQSPPQYPDQQTWASAAQRREHPGDGSSRPYQQPGYPAPARRSGAGAAFAVALIATVVGIGVSLAASYVSYHHRVSGHMLQTNLAEFGLTGWPSSLSRGGMLGIGGLSATEFAGTFSAAAIVLVILLWAAVGSVPGGRGGFGVFLAGWGATVVAGAVAVLVEFLLAANDLVVSQMVTASLDVGAAWAVRVGWIVGLVAAIGQVVRRRSV